MLESRHPITIVTKGALIERDLDLLERLAAQNLVVVYISITTLDAAMARHIEKALSCTNGCIEGKNGAARLLRINPHTLRARMRKLGVDWKRFRTVSSNDEAVQ